LNIAILTVSSGIYGKGTQADVCGGVVRDLLLAGRHRVSHWEIVPNDREKIVIAAATLAKAEDADTVFILGGTGLGKRDVTIEALKRGFEKELENFAPVFSMLVFSELGAESIMLRSAAGIINGKPVFCLPSVPKACEIAVEKIILPQLEELVKHAKEK